MNKSEQMEFAVSKVREILNYIRKDEKWEIKYVEVKSVEDLGLSGWERQYFFFAPGDEYFLIYINGRLMYTIDVSGDNLLTATYELLKKLAEKY